MDTAVLAPDLRAANAAAKAGANADLAHRDLAHPDLAHPDLAHRDLAHRDQARAPCYHCGDAIPPGSAWRLPLAPNQPEQSFCCAGCEAAAGFIHSAGLADYYQLRSAVPERPEAALELGRMWDSRTVERLHWRREADAVSVQLPLSGLKCAACSWLIERVLLQIPGVVAVEPSLQFASLSLRFWPEQVRLSTLVQHLAALGYQARLPAAGDSEQPQLARAELKRLAVAGLGMMQVMMFAEPLYFAAFGEPLPLATRDFFRWLGLLLTTPVLFYSGSSFLVGAWRELHFRQIGMDTLIALALLLAFGASVLETVRQGPDVYFDSVTMFVFFLLLARHLEANARRRSRSQLAALAQSQPNVAWRLRADAVGAWVEEEVPVAELDHGDIVRVYPGQAAPADGELLELPACRGDASNDAPTNASAEVKTDDGARTPEAVIAMNESLLTGESEPVKKRAGDPVYAGALAIDCALCLRVTGLGTNTLLQQMLRMMQDAMQSRPRMAVLAEHAARHFASALLLLCVLVAAYWTYVEPARAFAITLATLAVACPCALALAIPAALTAAQARMARSGVLMLRAQALETLARVEHVVFDKTGTLTSAEPLLERVELLGPEDEATVCGYAAALQRGSKHPIAHAFRGECPSLLVEEPQNHPALGVSGRLGARALRLGRSEFVLAMQDQAVPDESMRDQAIQEWPKRDVPERDQATADQRGPSSEPDAEAIYLGDEQGLLARFVIREQLRADAASTLARLRGQGLQLHVFSGDGARRVAAAAAELGITDARARLSPEAKLLALRQLQDGGAVVAMVGDGINDGPVLAGADVSFALASGASAAHQAADLVLLGGRLQALPEAIQIAAASVRVMRQNLAWAVAYNTCGIALAACGLMPPWLAALGMSASSLLVTVNALRLSRMRLPPTHLPVVNPPVIHPPVINWPVIHLPLISHANNPSASESSKATARASTALEAQA